jgi:hypothetical protein
MRRQQPGKPRAAVKRIERAPFVWPPNPAEPNFASANLADFAWVVRENQSSVDN